MYPDHIHTFSLYLIFYSLILFSLQSLCEKILLSHKSTAFTGLLRSPPQSMPELNDVLHECASPLPPGELLPGCTTDGSTIKCPPTTDKAPVKYKAEKKYHERLKALIEISLM
jgi:hypothetical protein